MMMMMMMMMMVMMMPGLQAQYQYAKTIQTCL
jgi:hypothetical protein